MNKVKDCQICPPKKYSFFVHLFPVLSVNHYDNGDDDDDDDDDEGVG